jgi:DNA repair protein RadC
MTPEQLARHYAAIEEQVRVSAPACVPVASDAFCEDDDVRRFFRRLGILSGRSGTAASQTVLGAIDAITRRTGEARDHAASVLAAYCRGDGEPASAVCGEKPQCDRCRLAAECRFFSKRPTIKDLPEGERPRERLLALGERQLTDAELLAILLGGGTQDQTAVDLARSVMTRFGAFSDLAACSPAELSQVRGIGPAKATTIKAALEIARRCHCETGPKRPEPFGHPERVADYCRPKLSGEKRECFLVLMLDIKNRLIRDVTVSQGSLTQSIVHPREVFQPAIRDSAASVIFVHNHPSGDTTPSREDIDITRRLKQTGDIIGIRVLDHVIVGEQGYTSLANERLL